MNSENWVQYKNNNIVSLHVQYTDNPTEVLIKRSMIINLNAKSISYDLENCLFLKKHVNHIEQISVITKLSQGHKIIHRLHKSMFLLDPRDFYY